MQEVDFFVMDFFPSSRQLDKSWLERGQVQKTADAWTEHVSRQCLSLGTRLNLRKIANDPFEDGLEFTIRARKEAFETSSTEIFILSDNDMLIWSAEKLISGIEILSRHDQFAILSALPEPHTIKPIPLPGRDAIRSIDVMEHYACGGFRFCRKFTGTLDMPNVKVPGYDGVFCRWLWEEHGKRVGYLNEVKAFHLGTHCTSLWSK